MIIQNRDNEGHPGDELATIDCETADEMFAPYLAHDLSRKRRDVFVNHIRTCVDCHDRLFALEFALQMALGADGDPGGHDTPGPL